MCLIRHHSPGIDSMAFLQLKSLNVLPTVDLYVCVCVGEEGYWSDTPQLKTCRTSHTVTQDIRLLFHSFRGYILVQCFICTSWWILPIPYASYLHWINLFSQNTGIPTLPCGGCPPFRFNQLAKVIFLTMLD